MPTSRLLLLCRDAAEREIFAALLELLGYWDRVAVAADAGEAAARDGDGLAAIVIVEPTADDMALLSAGIRPDTPLLSIGAGPPAAVALPPACAPTELAAALGELLERTAGEVPPALVARRAFADNDPAAPDGRYADLFSRLADAVVLMDAHTHVVVDANQRACELYDYPRQRFVGRCFLDVVERQQLPGVRDNTRAALVGQPLRGSVERIHRRRDGRAIHVRVSFAALSQGTRVLLQDIIRDETSRIAMHEALERSNRELGDSVRRLRDEAAARERTQAALQAALASLETEVARRTAELQVAHRSLERRSRPQPGPPADPASRPERMSAALESYGNITAGLAHELGNVLVVINGYSQLIASRGDEASAGFAAKIRRAVRKGTATTRQLLAFSRRHRPRSTEFDANTLVTETLELVAPALGERISVRCEPSAEPLRLRTDPELLSLVVMSLLLGARDAVGGAGELVTCLSRGADGAGRMRVLLDIGAPAQALDGERLRARAGPFAAGPAGAGGGPDLETTEAIVRELAGELALEADGDGGTRIRLSLPGCAQAPAPAPLAGQGRVLLVEDDPDVREYLIAVLAESGYEVLSAGSGAQALALCAPPGTGIDLLLTDVRLPDARGPGLAEQLLVQRPRLGVVYMSGYAPDLPDPPGGGRVQMLLKPFEPEALLSALARVASAADDARD